MTAVAAILDLDELGRLLKHIGLPSEFPKTKPSRGPPRGTFDEGGQVEPGFDEWDGKEHGSFED